MNHALLLNLCIVLVCLIGATVTKNPLCMLGLLAITPLPYGLAQAQIEADMDQDEDEGKPIGFTADVR